MFWYDRGHPVVHAARTNADATRIGATCSMTTPRKLSNLYKLAGNGSLGPLQLFINTGTDLDATQIYSKVVKPLPDGIVSALATLAPGGHLTVTVTDAGSPVKGAKVSLLGAHGATDKHGVVQFHVAGNAKKRQPRSPSSVTATRRHGAHEKVAAPHR